MHVSTKLDVELVLNVVCNISYWHRPARCCASMRVNEVVALWQSLPPFEHPLPGRVDAKLQKGMKDADVPVL
eukprot:3286399-Amphidinium_carterae.1